MALSLGPALGLTGLILSLPALIDNSINYSTRLREKISTFKNAGVILRGLTDEYRIYSNQLEASLVFVKDISPFLLPPLRETLQMALIQLNTASEVTVQLTNRAFDDEGNLRKVWFTLYGKSVLEKSLREVNKCQDIFLRSLHYTVLFGGSKVVTKVEEHVNKAPSLAMVQNLKRAILDSLKDSSTKKLRIESGDLPVGSSSLLFNGSNIRYLEPSDPDQQNLLVERHYNTSGTEFTFQKFRELARILSGTSLEMGILPCQGFITFPHCCDLVFGIPTGMAKPRTLRELLSSPINSRGIRHSLTKRINLAVELATAVMYVHTATLVHKSIRPENILILEPDSESNDPHSKYPHTLGTAVLMGFDYARFETDHSDRRGTDQWEKNIYMHPERQGDHLEVSYNMLHDIYSLGVVLLEIALWKSFVLEEISRQGVVTYKPNAETCRFLESNTKTLKDPKEIRATLIKKAEDFVPLVLGEKYRDVVLLCLNCLDGSFCESELLDADGILVGLVFIHKILEALKEISI